MLDDLIAIILDVLFAPYRWWKDRGSESVIGESEYDRKAARFWKWFAWITLGVLIGLCWFLF